MKDLKTVMSFTIKEMIKRKSFIISTLIILILIVVGFNIPNIIKTINGENNSKDKILIVDNDKVFEETLNVLNVEGEQFKIANENIRIEDVKKKVDEEEFSAAVFIAKENEKIQIKYILKNANMITAVPEEMINTFNTIYTNLQISKLGLTTEQLQTLTPNFEYQLEQTESQKASGNTFIIMLLSLILFYAIYFCAYQVSSSITIEKTSKVMETLVTSTTPRTIVIGKTIGIGIVGLIQIILIIGTAIVSAKLFLEPELIESVLDLSKITPFLGIITIIYFILGYFSYALLYALTGSTVSKPEDIQSANTPVAFLATIGFYLSYFTMMNPTSDLNMFASMFPISSPFCMPFRVMMGLASYTDIAISIGILLATIFVIAKVAIKIYSNAILNYGTKMTFKDIVKVYKDKNN